MKKILIVSLAFPPLSVVGVFRVAKFCKYLPQMGFKPFALTEKIREETKKDWGTLEDMGDGVTIIRTMNLQPFYWWDKRSQAGQPQVVNKPAPKIKPQALTPEVSQKSSSLKTGIKNLIRLIRKILTIPDARMAWIPQGFLPGLKAVWGNKIDVILSSSPNPSNHIMAYLLSKFTRRPHIVDYRDLWTLNGNYFMREIPDFLRKFDIFLERMVLKNCKGIVVVTNTLKKKLLEGFPDMNLENKIEVIFNGIDDTDYADIEIPEKDRNDIFQISYFGNLYGFRNPLEFIKGVAAWIERDPDVKDKIHVDFWGDHDPAYLADLSKYNLESVISYNSRIPQKDAIIKMLQSDLLLLIQGIDPLINDAIPTKLFEYLATGKPMLTFFPPGEAADIIRQDSRHLVVSEPDTSKIVEYFQKQFTLWRNNDSSMEQKTALPPQFMRKYQTEQLSLFINKILERKNK